MPTRKRTRGGRPPTQRVWDIWPRWLDRYLRHLEAKGQADKTLATRKQHLEKFIAYARQARVNRPEGLSSSLLRAYLVYRRECFNSRNRKDKPRTVNAHILSVRRFIDYLAKEGVTPPNLVGAVEYMKEQRALPRDTPSDKEVRRMLASIDTSKSVGLRDRALLEVLYSTGIRRQECQDLKVGDIDVNEGFLRVEMGKGGKGRIVPLGRMAAEWLRKYLLVVRPLCLKGRPDPGWLFLTKSGEQLDGEAVRQAVVKASDGARLGKKVTPHALRRACATEMIRRNANPYHVKELLGHEDFRSMDVYTRLTILDLKEAHKKHHPREQMPGEDDDDDYAIRSR